jgi:hypothetical protein
MAKKTEEKADPNVGFTFGVQCGGCRASLVRTDDDKLTCRTERCRFYGRKYEPVTHELVEVAAG